MHLTTTRGKTLVSWDVGMVVPIVEEAEWADHLAKLTVWATPQLPTLVIAPHPDDETLGSGGLIAALRQRGVPVNVVAVTDGESAYGNDASLGLLRREEQENALQLLGVERKAINAFAYLTATSQNTKKRLYLRQCNAERDLESLGEEIRKGDRL